MSNAHKTNSQSIGECCSFNPQELPPRSKWFPKFSIPRSLRWAVPSSVILAMREIKALALTSGTVWRFPRDIRIEQSPEEALAALDISIVVPIHDAPLVTRRCLASLERFANKSEIILVDDASNLAETLSTIQEFSIRNNWRVIRHAKSRGMSEACRAGSRFATRPYLCLLNSDTVLTHVSLLPIREALDSDETIGVAGPSSSNAGTIQTLPLPNRLCFYWNDDQICAFARQLTITPPSPIIADLSWVSGFAFFIRRELWEKIGGFDPNLPDYGNEVELCSRVAAMGYRNVWVGNSYIHHLGGQSYYAKIGEGAVLARVRAAEAYIGKTIIE